MTSPSDAKFVIDSVEQGGPFTISRPEARTGANFTFATGEFFSYVHDHPDEHITKTLARLGCWKEVNKVNYMENCLWLAFKDAGVEAHTLEAMKTEFKQRKIARKNIRKIAEDHKLFVTITTDGKTDGYGLKYGPRDGFPVELALVHDHYIHNFKTDIWRNARRSRLRRLQIPASSARLARSPHPPLASTVAAARSPPCAHTRRAWGREPAQRAAARRQPLRRLR